ncbi:hypothetical protein BJ508DRAFT_334661 [Ascobolus immersus RN42]|uniref:Uncharacterized protein n=1 Tax=Ascobolus immersus RN42 TaxID=1160509 RepID=A0A3N4HF85_ASCIM|nr:hypothetical protein BJ508DRAFT_334661 [Ascobolus immersus RN42]
MALSCHYLSSIAAIVVFSLSFINTAASSALPKFRYFENGELIRDQGEDHTFYLDDGKRTAEERSDLQIWLHNHLWDVEQSGVKMTKPRVVVSKGEKHYQTYQLVTRPGASQNCTHFFDADTIAAYGRQNEFQGLSEEILGEKVENIVKEIDGACDRRELTFAGDIKSLAELASDGKEYFDEKKEEYQGVIPETREKGTTRESQTEIYIEIICETSEASPLASDAEKLYKTQFLKKTETCWPYHLYRPDMCVLENKAGKARVQMCAAPMKAQKYEADDKSIMYQHAEEVLQGIHMNQCWYRQHVLPALIVKHCKHSFANGDERVGGRVRFATWVNRAGNNTAVEPKYSLIWVLDQKLYDCSLEGDC